VAWKATSLREAGTHIMGRVTYEEMASAWPNATGVYADLMNEIPKVVFSKTLTRAEWAESRIADGDLAEDIARLKREPGGVVLAHGGATFVDALIRDGLIDEYRLVIHPVAIGHGAGLFSALRGPLRLDLIEARRFPSVPSSTSTGPERRSRGLLTAPAIASLRGLGCLAGVPGGFRLRLVRLVRRGRRLRRVRPWRPDRRGRRRGRVRCRGA
jgi:dihydrofolate reductase